MIACACARACVGTHTDVYVPRVIRLHDIYIYIYIYIYAREHAAVNEGERGTLRV